MDSKLRIQVTYTAQINFAMQHNYVPVIRRIVVTNPTDAALENLQLTVAFCPEFAKSYSYPIEKIEAGQSLELPRKRESFDTTYLFSLTEKFLGYIHLSATQQEAVIYDTELPIELLSYDEWSGISVLPEMIAAFVMPNHPAITDILKSAAAYLKQWTGSPSFTGYQTDNPIQVKYQMAAIFSALHKEEIIYNNPPASFEERGQRIRLPHAVLSQKMGTCLDLSVLYATCLEAVGLFPMLCFVQGHAFCGCWLEATTFSDILVDDFSAITNRIAKGATEILLVECTDFVSGHEGNFDQAIAHATAHMMKSEQFHCAIDIKRTRASGILPMPTQITPVSGKLAAVTSAPVPSPQAHVQAPSDLDVSLLQKTATAPETPLTKQKNWERKLLDFSLRNTLLNFRYTKSTFQILVADLAELEDRLSDGKDFRIMQAPSDLFCTTRDMRMYETDTHKDMVQHIAAQEFQSARIRTTLSEDALEKTLKDLYRAAKTSMEENGSNTLFLALGFLKWYETERSEKERYAPIVLVPVEIVRNRKNKGYLLRSRQEEAQINITLLEYLRQDHNISITGLDPLPEDAHGIDVPLILHQIRQGIMGKKKWTIENMAFVGLFSFGQFVMWNDIHSRSADLEQNKIVSSLIEGHITWAPQAMEEAQDIEVAVKDMALPVSADSSQMQAIFAAAQGQSFVLHGPPGTGKSQTITNMIANALYQGKSVLFVAEKMAALNVVQKRLSDVGLAPFCLELHSNKTSKSTVLAALGRTLEVGKFKSPEEYQATGDKVHALRCQLNDIIEALHCPRWFGGSLYEAISYYQQHANFKGKITCDHAQIAQYDKQAIALQQELIRQYMLIAKEIGDYASHPLRTYKGMSYSIEIREAFAAQVQETVAQYDDVAQAFGVLGAWLGKDALDKAQIDLLLNAIEVHRTAGTILQPILTSPNHASVATALQVLIGVGLAYQQQLQTVQQTFDAAVFDYAVDTAKLEWKQADGAWLLAKMAKQGKLLKDLQLYATEKSCVTKENILTHYDNLLQLKQYKQQILDTPATLADLCAGAFFGTATDWHNLQQALTKTQKMYAICQPATTANRTALYQALPTIDRTVSDAAVQISLYLDQIAQLQSTFALDFDAIQHDWFAQIHGTLVRYLGALPQLQSMVQWNKIDAQLQEHGLSNVSHSYQSGAVDCADLGNAYQCNLYYACILLVHQQDARLSDFYGKQYDDIIVRYQQTLDTYQQLTMQELVARLSAKIPVSSGEGAASSEVGVLKRAIKNNGRMLSLRRLFDQTPLLLRKLAPCMLMSPISVAQYIDPSFAKFDLVIFDEASQLETSAAVGTIARGENVVIVGDPKQLPPTKFFSSNRIDEENSDKEDLESLLDDCLAISMPETSLKWHYRSRHESLIAYSNMKYYDNKLYTFPSPSDLTSEVNLVQLQGYYDKGGSKHNLAEAQAIVAEILRRLQDETLRKDSIGVVTFSSVQQNLIDDMLLDAFHKHPDLEEIDQKSKEPIFVKNLENVQGDERDVILFSIGYGPDQSGKVSLNFGPLNREGGWRRLNVAISRARKSMTVYAVLKPEQIDLNRTTAQGLEGLKGFLEFAARGKNIAIHQGGALQQQDDQIAKELTACIAAMGYQTQYNVGSSKFKVDIGIIHPDVPDTYLLGIMLDGQNCKNAATARDRFLLQPSVLRGLGWHMLRIWTLDWLDNRQKVCDAIEAAIAEARTAYHDALAQQALAASTSQPTSQSTSQGIMPASEPTFATLTFQQDDTPIPSCCIDYLPAQIVPQGTAADFYLPQTKQAIVAILRQIVQVEAPISQKALFKKSMLAWGIPRGSAKVDAVLKDCLADSTIFTTCDNERVFCWHEQVQPEQYTHYRIAAEDGIKRAIDDIAWQEIANVIHEVLLEQMSVSHSDLVREVAKKLGFTRLGAVLDAVIGHAIQCCADAGKIVILPNGYLALEE